MGQGPGAPDVIVAGAGPAGALAALILARAGVRVLLIDRAEFPRAKLCGDSINPGAMAILARHGLEASVRARALPITGMRLSGDGVVVRATYPAGVTGGSLQRHDLDALMVEAAMAAGARFEGLTRVDGAIVESAPGGTRRVTGVHVAGPSGRVAERRAPVVIAADGRRSALAFGLGLARHPTAPRRYALGTYFENVRELGSEGEMHVRTGHYVGIAPVPGGVANVCVVMPMARLKPRLAGSAARIVEETVSADPMLRDRFAQARRIAPVAVLGPMAVDHHQGDIDGLLLAGDAAGFVDPITGDGLRLAMRGAELVAAAVLDGGAASLRQLRRLRARELGGKLRVNLALRSLVGFPGGVRGASLLARACPSLFARLIHYAGDVPAGAPAT